MLCDPCLAGRQVCVFYFATFGACPDISGINFFTFETAPSFFPKIKTKHYPSLAVLIKALMFSSGAMGGIAQPAFKISLGESL